MDDVVRVCDFDFNGAGGVSGSSVSGSSVLGSSVWGGGGGGRLGGCLVPKKLQLAHLQLPLPLSDSQHSRMHLPTDLACWPPLGGGRLGPRISLCLPFVVAPLASAGCKAECFSSLSWLLQSSDA